MAKRKASPPVQAEVDESKKAKQDPPSEQSVEEIPPDVAVETSKAGTSGANALDYIQIILTGPRGCGKSSLVLSFKGELFPPNEGEFLSKQYLHTHDKKRVMIWDLDARNEFESYRKKSYSEADIALLCYDVKKPVSVEERRGDLEESLRSWIKELQIHCRGIPIILVGLKKDVELNSGGNFYTSEQISFTRRKWSKMKWWYHTEVSAHMDKKGVEQLFAKAINRITTPKSKGMFANCGFEIHRPDWFV